MVAVAAKDAEAFIRNGHTSFPLVMIYGPNEGLVSERAGAIAQSTTQGDAGNIMRFDGDDIASDPLRLADEANAISMFGGMRAIRIRMGSKSLAAALEPLIASPPQDARVIVEAGDIKSGHALRSLLEKTKTAAVLACYAEEQRDISRFLDDCLGRENLSIAADTRALLVSLLGMDRRRSRMELEKLFLYCRGEKQIRIEDIEAVITDAASLTIDSVIDATFLGRLENVEAETRRVLADGMDPAVLLGFILRHIFLLQAIKRACDATHTVAESIKAHRVNWKREKSVAAQLERWTEQRLERAVQIIGEAVFNTRRNPALANALAIRSLWSLALSVTRK